MSSIGHSVGLRRGNGFRCTENEMIASMDQRKRGRPSKGERITLAGKVPIPIKGQAQRRASELGIALNDYMALLIVADVDAHPSHDPGRSRQIGGTA